MFQNVDFSVGALNSFFIAFVLEFELLPPDTCFLDAAAKESLQDPGPLVLCEGVVELAALNDCALEGLIGLFS